MKRICSALLAIALCIFLSVPAAAAGTAAPAFSDAQDVTHLEAAANLVRLGVMSMEDGGRFDPQGTVTRAEAVKCVALILSGGKDIAASAGAPPAFPDVKGHWAEAYINYCAEKGVAFAQEDGDFDPDGVAARLELVRMLEVALGHNAGVFAKWPGAWQGPVDAAAYDWGLYTDLEETPFGNGKPIKDGPLRRDEAVQLLYNALNATPKTWVPGKAGISSVGAYEDVKRPDGTPSTLLYENFGYAFWDEVPALPAADPTAFTDAKDIAHWDAVASLARLGVVKGRDDGSFDPAGHVTRAEAAKLIAVLMNGGAETTADVKVVPSFTDVKGHWAETSIEYCADMKIIGGCGDGSFDPDGNVSVVQMYKMALAALGYDPETYALTGSGWAEETKSLAKMAGLNKGLPNEGMDGAGADQPATREAAAQILCNALLTTPMAAYPSQVHETGELIWEYRAATRFDGQPETLLHQRFGLEELPAIPAQPTA